MAKQTRAQADQLTPASPVTRTAGRGAEKIPAQVRIKVRAISPQGNGLTCGYYNHIRRREGDVFFIRGQEHFSAKWMELVIDDAPTRVTTQKQAMRKQHDEILAAQNPQLNGADPDDDPASGGSSSGDEDDDDDPIG